MSKQTNFYVVLPCYNESMNIEKVVGDFVDVYSTHPEINLKFVLINDGSKDNTLDILYQLKNTYPNVQVIDHGTNKGLGAAVRTGMSYVMSIAEEEDLLCVLDSDFTHKAEYSLGMIEKVRAGKDVVIASRFYKGSKVYDVPWYRVILSVFARIYYTLSFRIKGVRDYTCGYRVYTLKILRKLRDTYGDNMIEENTFACMAELLVKLNNVGAHFGESFFKLYYGDKGGVSSMVIWLTIRSSLKMPLNINKYRA